LFKLSRLSHLFFILIKVEARVSHGQVANREKPSFNPFWIAAEPIIAMPDIQLVFLSANLNLTGHRSRKA
jgi:hypothetical protein